MRPAARKTYRSLLRVVLLLAAAAFVSHVRAAQTAPRIYDVAAARFIDERALLDRLAQARFRLLGEMHDNAEHHAIRARLIDELAARGLRPGVAMEVFDLDREAALAAAQVRGTHDAEAIASAGALDRRAWRWPMHKPLIDAALAAGLPIHAANLSRAELLKMTREHERSGDEHEAAWHTLEAARWTPAQQAELAASIVEGHCETLPQSIVGRIVEAQRLRDAAMAQALVRAATADGAILIAGDGHVRTDVGVPVYLAALQPGARSVSVGLIEAADLAEAGLATDIASARTGFDYVWLTSTAEREDPCATLRR